VQDSGRFGHAAGGQGNDGAAAQGVVFEGQLADGLLVQGEGPAQVGVLSTQSTQVGFRASSVVDDVVVAGCAGSGMRGRKCLSIRSA
jgi:hypothetical protein